MLINRNDSKDVVIMSIDKYKSLKETNYPLTGKNREVLLKSIQELEREK
ncbi:type II toxin-antitoxin system Phd/YefM family antitoxin [Galbibacter sp.]